MLTYSFSDIGAAPLYQSLYKFIKDDILRGELKPGEKLPSKRSLAKNLGVSTITVENAYGQLVAEGYICSAPKRGYFVQSIAVLPAEALKAAPAIEAAGGGDRGHVLADFTSNQTRPELFPFSIQAKILRELLRENQAALLTNSPPGGIPELREAIAEHLKSFRGMTVLPEQIIVGSGTEYLYGILIQLLGFDRRYGMEDPGYDKLAKIYRSYGVDCRYLSVTRQGVRVEELEEKGVDILHISPSHHFPTGVVTPISSRYELLGWASRADRRYIIEDDYDSEFRLSGQPIPTLQSIDATGKVIYINTFTKTLASTIRISYLVLPLPLLSVFQSGLGFYSCTVSNLEQYALARFIREGYFEKHINRMRNHYREQRDKLLTLIKCHPLSPRVRVMEENSGLHFLVELDTPLSDGEVCARLAERGIYIFPLSRYYFEPRQDVGRTFIVNYSSLDGALLEQSVDLLLSTALAE